MVAERLGHALQSLASELADQHREVAALKKENARLKANRPCQGRGMSDPHYVTLVPTTGNWLPKLHDLAVRRARCDLDIRFFWRLMEVLPAAQAAAGDLREAEADVAR